jgi:hypothetical protein
MSVKPMDVRTTAAALARRLTTDYQVLTAGSAASRLAELERLARSRDEIALLATDQHLPDDDGVAFLEIVADVQVGAGHCGGCQRCEGDRPPTEATSAA